MQIVSFAQQDTVKNKITLLKGIKKYSLPEMLNKWVGVTGRYRKKNCITGYYWRYITQISTC